MSKKIKKLIDGQTIRIDDHRADGRSIHDWADSSSCIHLHKESNSKKDYKYDVKIPLNSELPATVSFIDSHGREKDKLPKNIVKEIRSVFSREQERQDFFKNVFEELANFKWTRNSDDEQRIAEKVASCFGLEIKNFYMGEAKDNVPHLLLLTDEKKKPFYLLYRYSTKQTFLGEFQPCPYNGIAYETQKSWTNLVESNIGNILTILDPTERSRYIQGLATSVRGIGKSSFRETQEYFEWLMS